MKNDLLLPLAMISGFSVLSLSVITAAGLLEEKQKLNDRLSGVTQPVRNW